MMKKRDLIALLERIPGNPPIVTWDATAGSDLVIETAQLVDGALGERVLVLGMELPANDSAETVWSDR